MTNRTDQRGARAGNDVVGRDSITNHIYNPSAGHVEVLLTKLKKQIENDEQAKVTIEELARYHHRRAPDGIHGLKAKLEAANRIHLYDDAIEKKEMFVKLLEKYSLYSSAQHIFAHFLSKTENTFNYVIYPDVCQKTESELNSLVIEHIVEPIINECGSDVFVLNYGHVFGMVYWLAEQCFIRWHR